MARVALQRPFAAGVLSGTGKRISPATAISGTGICPSLFGDGIFKREMSSKKGTSCPEILSYMGDLDAEQKQLVQKMMNFEMVDGKSTKVRSIVYDTFRRLARSDRDVVQLVTDAVENTKPICEVVKVGISGTVYDVPGIVGKERQQTLAVRWIFDAALKRRTNKKMSLEKCLFAELLDAYRKKGIARKRRETIHGLASANRSFAHYRWW